MSRERDLLNALVRTELVWFLRRCLQTLNPGAAFLPNWHVNALAHRLEQVRRGEIKRLIINAPPRYLKSIFASVVLPAFVLGHDPKRRILCLSYGHDLAEKHAADFRAIVQCPWYQAAFPTMQVKRVANSDVFTSLRGFRRTTSVGGTLTGLGGDMIIIDDPQKPIDAQSQVQRDQLTNWFSNTLVSRLDNKEESPIIVVMQRIHMNDLTGYLLERSAD